MPPAHAPLVSVVAPTYNRAHLITDALDSALAQTYRPLELIIVDDGSTDATADTVEAWRRRPPAEVAVRYVRQANSGGNAARNKGVAESRGDIIAFLDSDDTWLPAKLEKQVAVLQADARRGAVYCGLREEVIETGEVRDPAPHAYPEGDLLSQLIVRDVTGPTSTFIVRRDVFEEAGLFDETLKARQDWDMWIRIAARRRIGCVPEALVRLRLHDGPRTAADPQREIDAYRRIRAKYADLRRAQPPPVRCAALSAYHRRMGRVSRHYRGQALPALGHYLAALAIWPLDFDNYAALFGWFLPSGPRARLHRAWNRLFGRTGWSIRSH
ncbi:MAG: glycosyltransferase family 2 protein [Caulobacterales bacterium]|nr:glycosyltransferase family 2 protein [Caulobacterales bacterium]